MKKFRDVAIAVAAALLAIVLDVTISRYTPHSFVTAHKTVAVGTLAFYLVLEILIIAAMGYGVTMLASVKKIRYAVISGIVFPSYGISQALLRLMRLQHQMKTPGGREAVISMIPGYVLIGLGALVLCAGLSAFGGWMALKKTRAMQIEAAQ